MVLDDCENSIWVTFYDYEVVLREIFWTEKVTRDFRKLHAERNSKLMLL
jgi:hypothetical protein